MERPRRPDLEERFVLEADPEDVLRRLLDPEDVPPEEGETLEADDS